MPLFRQKPGTTSAVRSLKSPFPDINAFDTAVHSLILKNPLACSSYRCRWKLHPPIEKVREMYTARFTYTNPKGKRVGTTSEIYDSVEGYHTGVAAVISNIANREAHRGKIRHTPDADRFSVLLKCHDPSGELYFLSLARDRITLSSYRNDAIRETVEKWAGTVPELA